MIPVGVLCWTTTTTQINLSTRPEKSVGDDAVWARAESALQGALQSKGWAYTVDAGGGAFYGPKIDIKIKDAIGRNWQCSTVQLDFNLPERFAMEYKDSDGTKQRPIMIHRAIFGSLERFFGILVENYAGVCVAQMSSFSGHTMCVSVHHVCVAVHYVPILLSRRKYPCHCPAGNPVAPQQHNACNLPQAPSPCGWPLCRWHCCQWWRRWSPTQHSWPLGSMPSACGLRCKVGSVSAS